MQPMLKLFWKYRYVFFIITYLLLRLFLLNINAAEWGDSYRILRATHYLENFSYPLDEKRPPLFSAFLLMKVNPDYIESSRVLMTILSFSIIGLFYLLLTNINWKLSESQKFLAVLFFSLNPLFLYWSIRVYADSLFILFLLLALNFYYLYLRKESKLWLILLAVVVMLAILTRFEGYLLLFGISLGLLISSKKRTSFIYFILPLAVFYVAVVLNPQLFFYKNPLTSSYVDEANSRNLSVREVLNYFAQLLFVMGNLFSFYFFAFSKDKLIKFFKANVVLFFIMGLHLALSFVWYAAVPRLFLPLVPFLAILLPISLDNFFEKTTKISVKKYFELFWKKENLHYTTLALLSLGYLLGQKYLKLPFLLTKNTYIIIALLLGLVSIPLIISHFKKLVITLFLASSLIWALMFISLEKDVYRNLNDAVLYLKNNYPVSGKVLTNDISSISRYYFENSYLYSDTLDNGKNFETIIKQEGVEFVIITNEHNPDMSFTPSKHPYISVIKEFRGQVSGREFFTILAKTNSK